MLAMITTEEYKELVLAKDERDKLVEELAYADQKLLAAQDDLKELLLMLTDGHTVSKFGEAFESYDIVSDSVIAKFISENYMTKGLLKFTKNKGEQK